jgi:hypothetical protein
MTEATTVCTQCGWDRSQDAPPTQDPADKKARIGVAAALAVAYWVMFTLISGTDATARPLRPANPSVAVTEAPTYTPEPVTGEAIALGALPSVAATASAAPTKPGKLLAIKVADARSASIQPHDALQYQFEVPETDQKCELVGSLHGLGGFDRDLEVFLLTDDEYLFWHANPAAIPHSSWETVRGSETTLHYQLPGAGIYHLVISNVMSPASKNVQVRAHVKCTR